MYDMGSGNHDSDHNSVPDLMTVRWKSYGAPPHPKVSTLIERDEKKKPKRNKEQETHVQILHTF